MAIVSDVSVGFLNRMNNPPKRGKIIIGTTNNAHLIGKNVIDLPINIMDRRIVDKRLNIMIDVPITPRVINIAVNKRTIPRQKCSLRPESKKILIRGEEKKIELYIALTTIKTINSNLIGSSICVGLTRYTKKGRNRIISNIDFHLAMYGPTVR
jgi:hypothetical protein